VREDGTPQSEASTAATHESELETPPATVLIRGEWRYVGGIPGWQGWGTNEKDSQFALSPELLDLLRDQDIALGNPQYSIPVAAIRGCCA
jgi:hypothetical protein